MNEAEFYQQWLNLDHENPFDLAVAAGATAKSPGLIFLAGYQACIQATFPELGGGRWYTFAVSEDRNPESTRPGVSMEGGRLTGFKTWIAGVNAVDVLVLKVGNGAEANYVTVNAQAEGVILTAKPRPGFLPDMSQGMAEFREAEFTPLKDLTNVKRFQRLEPFYIYLAFLGHVAAMNNELSARAKAVLDEQKTSEDLISLDKAAGELMEQLLAAGIELGDNWETDQRLFTMYSKGIQATG